MYACSEIGVIAEAVSLECELRRTWTAMYRSGRNCCRGKAVVLLSNAPEQDRRYLSAVVDRAVTTSEWGVQDNLDCLGSLVADAQLTACTHYRRGVWWRKGANVLMPRRLIQRPF